MLAFMAVKEDSKGAGDKQEGPESEGVNEGA